MRLPAQKFNKAGELYGRDVLGLGSLLASDNLHGYLLAFVQSFAAFALDCAEMNEYILPAFLLNKSKPFRVVEPLDGSFY